MTSLSLALDTLILVSYCLALRRHGHHLDLQDLPPDTVTDTELLWAKVHFDSADL